DNQMLVEGLLQLPDSLAQGVACPEAGAIQNLVKIHAVVPAVEIVYVIDLDVRELFANHFRDLRESMIQTRIADVEYFAADQSHRGFQHPNGGVHQIAHMDEGAPLLAVVYGDHAVLVGFGSEQVDHQVETGAMSQAKDRGVTQHGGMEGIASG